MMVIDQYAAHSDRFKAQRQATDDLLNTIADRNGYLTAAQVRTALESGQRVYTALSYYVRRQQQESAR
jgi:hypothetical protein